MVIGSCTTITESPTAVHPVDEPHNPSRPSRLAAPDGGNLQVRCDGRGPGPRAVVRIEAPMQSRKGSVNSNSPNLRYRAGSRPK